MDKEDTQRIIPGSTPATPPVNFSIPEEATQKLERATPGEPAEQKFVRDVVYYLVIILFIGFTTMFVGVSAMLWNAWTSKQATYEDLKDQVLQQNAKIDMLSNKINQFVQLVQQRGVSAPAR